jgi:hypothetical protein
LKIKPKKTQHLKLQLPHQVESSMTQLFDVISQQIGKASWIVQQHYWRAKGDKISKEGQHPWWENTEGKPHQHYEPLQLNQYWEQRQ